MKTSIVTVAPTSLAVTLAAAKSQLRIDDSVNDHEIVGMIQDAMQWIERRYSISLITQTRKQLQDQLYERYPIYRNFLGPYYSRFPVTLLYPPVQSITSFSYYDTDQVLRTLTENTDYFCAGKMSPIVGSQDIEIPRMWPNSSWPNFKWIPDAIQIVYVTGFGPDPSYIPGPIRRAILMLLSHYYENRLEEITGERVAKFEMDIATVMSSYEIYDHVGIYA